MTPETIAGGGGAAMIGGACEADGAGRGESFVLLPPPLTTGASPAFTARSSHKIVHGCSFVASVASSAVDCSAGSLTSINVLSASGCTGAPTAGCAPLMTANAKTMRGSEHSKRRRRDIGKHYFPVRRHATARGVSPVGKIYHSP